MTKQDGDPEQQKKGFMKHARMSKSDCSLELPREKRGPNLPLRISVAKPRPFDVPFDFARNHLVFKPAVLQSWPQKKG